MEAQFKPRICAWEDLSLTDTEKLQRCQSNIFSIQDTLQEILGSKSEGKQAMIEIDLYAYAMLFAKTNDFSAPQMSALFTILKSVHELCISSPFDNQEQALELFNAMLVRHSVTRPPYSVALFSLLQVKTVRDYVLTSYFKHYKMYKYAFTKRVRLDLKLTYEGDKGEECVVERQGGEEPLTTESDRGVEEQTDVAEVEDEPSKEEEDPKVDEQDKDKSDLKDIVSSTLSKKLKDLEVTIEQEISSQEQKLSQRIGALEQMMGEKTKQKR